MSSYIRVHNVGKTPSRCTLLLVYPNHATPSLDPRYYSRLSTPVRRLELPRISSPKGPRSKDRFVCPKTSSFGSLSLAFGPPPTLAVRGHQVPPREIWYLHPSQRASRSLSVLSYHLMLQNSSPTFRSCSPLGTTNNPVASTQTFPVWSLNFPIINALVSLLTLGTASAWMM